MGTGPTFDEELTRYVTGAGPAYAARLVQRWGLPRDLGADLVQETALAVKRANERGRELGNVAAYATQTMRNIAVGLLQGKKRDEEWFVDLPPLRDSTLEGPDPLDQVPVFDSYDLGSSPVSASGVRAAVADRLDDHPWAAAGALAFLSVRDLDDPASRADDCPQPKGGATPREAASWVGVFYAGRRDCWPGDDDPPKIRQRRSRYVKAQDAVLAAAADEAGLRPGADHA